MDCTTYVAKTKALISFAEVAVTAKLICVFVFAYAKSRFSHDTAHLKVKTRFDVYETLCPQQMLVHKGGQIKNWSGEYRDIIPTKLQCQAIRRALQSPNLQREINPKK